MTALEMAERVQDYMDGDGIKYEYHHDDEKPRIDTGFSLKCKLQSVKMYLLFSKDGYCVLGVSPMKADESSRDAVMEYVTRANYGLRNGNFEMDVRDGEVRYKVFVPCRYLEPDMLTNDMIEESIYLTTMMLNRYGNGLCAIMMGFSDPETEITKAEE